MPDTRDLALGATVYVYRQKRHLTQRQVARLMELRGHPVWSPGTVSQVEHGRRRLRMSEAGALARTLGVTVKQLLEAANQVDRGLVP